MAKHTPMSKTRRRYVADMVVRCIVFVLCAILYYFRPEDFDVLQGMNFWKKFSPLHILWGIWVVDMIYQIFPIKSHVAIGSRKLFSRFFVPMKGTFNYEKLKRYTVSTAKHAGLVMVLWCLLIAGIGAVRYSGIIDDKILFLITALFYIFDLVCVLIWCPFRLIMKTRCCTTCRIFNWDHFMMFSPIIFIPGFFSWSLFGIALIVLIRWEMNILLHPERFWEGTNVALRCSECTDKLCTQYCKK